MVSVSVCQGHDRKQKGRKNKINNRRTVYTRAGRCVERYKKSIRLQVSNTLRVCTRI